MLQTALTVLPIVMASLYLLGLTFHQGFLLEFGIEETLFPLSVDRTLFQGFVALMTLGAKPLYYAVIAMLAVFSTALLAVLLASNQRIRSWGHRLVVWLIPSSNTKPLSAGASRIFDRVSAAFIYAVGALAIYIALLVVALTATKSGREQASHLKEQAAKNGDDVVVLYPSNGASPITGKPILCNTLHCAYWLGKEAVILKHESVERIVTHSRSLQEAPVSLSP